MLMMNMKMKMSENDTEAVKNNNLFERFAVDVASEASHKEHGEVSIDEYNSEELVSLDEDEPSDEEGIVVKKVRRKRKAPRFTQFRRETDLLNPNFYLGMEFPDMKACREAVRLQKTKYATWLAERFDEELRDHPNMSVGAFMTLVYKAKRKAKRRTHALKRGFAKRWRPVVGFDGCNIKGSHPGQILSADRIDANNRMFPLAFAVIEIKNTKTWTWFMECNYSFDAKCRTHALR
ncbi:bifunctional lysine-specific demethylase and histidyl-hydroxylase NO66-like [Pyrus ussuriensis x Pyrus communis]|uniref:Bifunctional lysine-specific demethylase and histidyl-hydroxylase NO66-like n=1 Tax=Pyrus ussuriensis x Pyrus communis TaxID=2448454 RepID=A0A5N5H8E3_9ROSA|nr:bifunctional lysine-specific demethylase and histidyl-hydroxylase NO66-like [Pyrus ussuriensis x Pyrus communis]